MRSFDLAPLYRATVGFDQIADLMDRVLTENSASPSYPPYNIEKMSEDAWRISIAVAGFAEDELSVELKENALLVSAKKSAEDENNSYLHRGIANRAFERKFNLADYIEVSGADLVNGLLTISLVKEIPEAMKPRSIGINQPGKVLKHEVSDNQAA